MIRIKNVTKDYGHHRGVFGLDFEVEDGESFGLMGPEKSGKSTVARLLMGFGVPDTGACVINGKNSHVWSDDIMKYVGYLPSESFLPKEMTGIGFVRMIAAMRGLKNLERVFELIDRFEIKPEEKIRRMSNENRRVIMTLCTFMHHPRMLILDEPTLGLEPVMRERFIEILLEEKERGTTIFLTSKVLEVVERLCDRVGMIWEGNMVNIDDIGGIREKQRKNYIIKFADQNEVFRFMKEPYEVIQIKECQMIVNVQGEMMSLIHTLNNYKVTSLEATVQCLEETFPHYYGGRLHA